MFEKYLQGVYAFWSSIYDSVLDPLFKFDRKKVVSALNVKNGDKILEVGVGTGLNLKYYPKCTVYGIDLSKAMLAKARKKRSKAKVTLQYMDASKMSLSKGTFDKALMTYVLRVAPQPRKVLKELARVLKPNGTVVILDQFKTGKSFLQPIMLALGWGKQHDLDKLLKGLPFKIKSRKQFGKAKGTQLVVLQKR